MITTFTDSERHRQDPMHRCSPDSRVATRRTGEPQDGPGTQALLGGHEPGRRSILRDAARPASESPIRKSKNHREATVKNPRILPRTRLSTKVSIETTRRVLLCHSSEVSESQLGLSISNDTTNAVNDTMVGTSVPPTLQVAVQLPLPLVQASRPATTTEPEYYLSLSECRKTAVRSQPLAVRVDPITRYHQFRPVDQLAFHMRHINIDMMAVELPHVSAIRDATPSTGSSSTSPSTSKARVPAAMQYTRPSVKRVEIAAEVESNVQRTNDEMDELNWQHALLTTTSSRTTTVTTYKRPGSRAGRLSA